MNQLTLSQSAQFLRAEHVGGNGVYHSVSTDTRSLQSKDLFVALQGPHFDGHDYLMTAEQRGAVGAVVSRINKLSIPQLVVADTRRALGSLAAHWLQTFRRPVVAITGSNGKTTVKEMVAAVLSQQGQVLATKGNLNNDIGLPLTLLRLQYEDYVVVEMGASHAGEIAYLADIARPDIVILNNVGRAHLEGFGSVEAIARAKGEIISGLQPDGRVVINADDPWSKLWRKLADGHQVTSFGIESAADIRGDLTRLRKLDTEDGVINVIPVTTPDSEIELRLALSGRHNIMNALAAIAAGWVLGLSQQQIVTGLAGVRPAPGRLQSRHTRNGWHIIDDTYNANPDSVGAAIAVLQAAPGDQWLVLGDLAELGPDSEQLHRELGHLAAQSGIKHLYTLGHYSHAASDAFGPGGCHFDELSELIAALRAALTPSSWIMVKGSRSARMERVVDALEKQESH